MFDTKERALSLTALALCAAIAGYVLASSWFTLQRLDEMTLLMGNKERIAGQLRYMIAGGGAATLAFLVAIGMQATERFAVASWIAGGFAILGIAATILVGSVGSALVTALSGTAVYFLRQEAGDKALEEFPVE